MKDSGSDGNLIYAKIAYGDDGGILLKGFEIKLHLNLINIIDSSSSSLSKTYTTRYASIDKIDHARFSINYELIPKK